MRISPISFNQYRNNLNNKRNQNSQKINFGIIKPEDRDEVERRLGFYELDDRPYVMNQIEKAQGVEVKLGSKDNPRGMVYADLIPEAIEKSAGKRMYKYFEEDCLDHLENEDTFEVFYDNLYDVYRLENNIPYSSSDSESVSLTFEDRQKLLLQDFFYFGV